MTFPVTKTNSFSISEAGRILEIKHKALSLSIYIPLECWHTSERVKEHFINEIEEIEVFAEIELYALLLEYVAYLHENSTNNTNTPTDPCLEAFQISFFSF